MLVTIAFVAAFAPYLAPYDPSVIEPVERLLPPSLGHLFGTDQFGRDTFSRVVYGTRLALLIGVGVVAFALVTGVPAGVLSALYPRLGRFLMRVIDVLMSFPALLLAFGADRHPRAKRRQRDPGHRRRLPDPDEPDHLRPDPAAGARRTYVEAAISMGGGAAWTIRKHILPNLISPLLVQASFVFAFAQLSAASLDFLGLGAPPDIPSWGNMLAESRIFITRAPWLLFFPGHGRSPSPPFRSTSSATPCAIGSIRASARCSAATGDRRCCG